MKYISKYVLCITICFSQAHEAFTMESDDQIHWRVNGVDIPINERDETGLTLLHKAVLGDNKIDAELLIGSGVDVNAIDNNGISPLWYALFENNYDMVEILLKAKAEANLPDGNGCKPIEFVQSTGNLPLVNLLLKYGITATCNDENIGLTPLHLAIINKDTKKALDLIRQFPELIEIRTSTDASPLSMAVIFKQEEIVKALLKAGANPNKTNASGLTPENMAALLGVPSLLNSLYEYSPHIPSLVGEQITASKCIDVLASSFYKRCCKKNLDKKIKIYEIKLLIFQLFSAKNAQIRMIREEKLHAHGWNSVVDFGISDSVDFKKILTNIFVNFYGNQRQHIVQEPLSVDEWLGYMQTAVQSSCKINIKPLLYYGLLGSKTAELDLSDSAKTLGQWVQEIEHDQFKFLNLVFEEIVRKKNTSERISSMDIAMLGQKSERVLKVLIAHRKEQALTKKKLKKAIAEITKQNIRSGIKALQAWKPKNIEKLQNKLDALGENIDYSLPNLFYINQFKLK